MSTDSNQACGRADLLREYAFDELTAAERGALEQHLAGCDECSLELDRLRLTVAALRVVPDREIPRRIAFVSDSPGRRNWLEAFWSSGARLGFASACVLSVAMVTLAFHRPAELRAMAQVSPAAAGLSKQQVDAAIAQAVAQVRSEVKAEDARNLQVALETIQKKNEQERRALLVAMDEDMTLLRKRLNTYAIADMVSPAGGQ